MWIVSEFLILVRQIMRTSNLPLWYSRWWTIMGVSAPPVVEQHPPVETLVTQPKYLPLFWLEGVWLEASRHAVPWKISYAVWQLVELIILFGIWFTYVPFSSKVSGSEPWRPHLHSEWTSGLIACEASSLNICRPWYIFVSMANDNNIMVLWVLSSFFLHV